MEGRQIEKLKRAVAASAANDTESPLSELMFIELSRHIIPSNHQNLLKDPILCKNMGSWNSADELVSRNHSEPKYEKGRHDEGHEERTRLNKARMWFEEIVHQLGDSTLM